MCFRNTGKLHPKIYNGHLPHSPQQPHADLSTILSLLFKNLPPEQLQGFLADPATVNNITQTLNGLAEQLHLQQTFQFQVLVKQSSVNNISQPDAPQNCLLPPPHETQTIATNDMINTIHGAFQEGADNIPTVSQLTSTIVTKTKTYDRKFCLNSGVINSSSWPELLSRQIKGDRVKQTLSICAFDA